MPPKRQNNDSQAGAPPAKKQKKNATTSSSESDEDDDELPVCFYDGKCYRKNPHHFKEYRHPIQDAQKKQDESQGKTAGAKKSVKSSIGYADDSDDDYVDSDEDQPPKKKQKVTKSTGSKSAASKSAPSAPSAPAPAPVAVAPAVTVTPTPPPAALAPLSASVPSHTSSAAKLHRQTSLSSLIKSDSQQDTRPGLNVYRTLLSSALSSTTKLSVDIKRMLQKCRKDNSVSMEEHEQILGMFGWTPDEYELGEKEPEEVDVEEERKVLEDPDGFKLIEITAENHAQRKDTEIVWAKASAKFFQTMKKAQGNYTIEKITVIVCTKLIRQFQQKQREYASSGDAKRAQIQWGFHGSTPTSIRAIARTGFKHPDELKKMKKGKAGVKLLDDGYFGKGIYFSCYSDYAMWYSEERESNEILLCSLLPGRIFQCTDRMDGEDRKPNYDSHYSPKGNEIIVFESSQILPRYILQFAEEEAKEREQED